MKGYKAKGGHAPTKQEIRMERAPAITRPVAQCEVCGKPFPHLRWWPRRRVVCHPCSAARTVDP